MVCIDVGAKVKGRMQMQARANTLASLWWFRYCVVVERMVEEN